VTLAAGRVDFRTDTLAEPFNSLLGVVLVYAEVADTMGSSTIALDTSPLVVNVH
jgi:hypothetical protein